MGKDYSDKVNNKRKYFRIQLDKPICSNMTVSMVHGKLIRIGYSSICVKNIGPGGLAFISHLSFPVDTEIFYNFKIDMFMKEVRLRGTIVRSVELKDNVFEYGVKFDFLENDEYIYIQLFNRLSFSLNRSTEKCGCKICTREIFPCTKK